MKESEVTGPLAYLLLGTTGAGRREVLLELIRSELEEEPVAVLLPLAEPENKTDKELEDLPNTIVSHWKCDEERGVRIEDEFPSPSYYFFIADGQCNPVEEVDCFRNWLIETETQLGRIITVIDSRFLYNHPGAKSWYEACIHFSDAVLFSRRTDVPNKWFKTIEAEYRKACYPCLFEQVGKSGIRNPALVLFPEPRRMSLVFDTLGEETDHEDIQFEDEPEGEDDEMEGDEDDMFQKSTNPDHDPYLQRNAAGQRKKRIPDIRRIIETAE